MGFLALYLQNMESYQISFFSGVILSNIMSNQVAFTTNITKNTV